MSTLADAPSHTPQSLPEAVVRLLRHEVGDLLQTVYAAVAILRERLPPGMPTERRILGDMRGRAEVCKELLDTVHDLVAPLTLEPEAVDIAAIVEPLVDRAAERNPSLEVRLERGPAPTVSADPRRVGQVAQLLLLNACTAATGRVVVRVNRSADACGVELTVLDDGPGVPPERVDWLFNVQSTVASGHLGPGLPLARRLVLLHGGRIRAGNRAEGGFRVAVEWPQER